MDTYMLGFRAVGKVYRRTEFSIFHFHFIILYFMIPYFASRHRILSCQENKIDVTI